MIERPPILANIDPSVLKWSKWIIILLIARAPRPVSWANFIALNPLIRKLLQRVVKTYRKDFELATVKRRLSKLSNFITSVFLLFASADNDKIPKDYGLIYIWMSYYGELNPPSALNILVSPHISPFLKVNHYRSKWLTRIYRNKEYVIYPMIFAQILSNYLTPTRYKLNQRYLSSSIKKWLLNPIWINYSLGVGYHSLDWLGLFKSYLFHNVCIFSFIALTNFKARFLDRYYELKHKIYPIKTETYFGIIKNYLLYAFHTSNSIINFIYCSNLLSIFFITISSPILAYSANPTSPANFFQRLYLTHSKFFFKSYVKTIGALAAFITLYINSMDLLPDTGYHSTAYENSLEDSFHNVRESKNVRRISKSFFDALNLYLFRLILLSKWRILKENHPWFKLLTLKSWNRIEAIAMSYGIWKIMNLNDFVRWNNIPENFRECARLQNESLIKLVDRIM
ncbi:hypothetical protein HYPBUDRAFT_145467 [Hyphopichia burtonii NRRL Y-1933]|uniref:Uncharacterized protein n=1 Tax=Hyphopichia burtonii NRRL Y-1933 TaxID=984485 RepID=A0A1E4RBR0_9ASCO|nr:hypothetical protein HYPBUDRAFT_145467 [Hyphopichia burtonii NRRL Y-1933]ODV64704.1 hypothetical protein HYPBUDRAFT_145467 [Hyphopichia burtonii NRRL Y-1933]